MRDSDRSGRRRSAPWWVAGVILVAVAVAVGPRLVAHEDQTSFVRDVRARSRVDFSFDVPPGTSERIQLGEAVTVLPSPLVVSVGDTIRIRDLDADPILLGPFYLGAHETLTQRFTEPGRFVGACAAHPSGQLVVEVRR